MKDATSRRIWKGGQSWHLESLYNLTPAHLVRIRIEHNAYEFQSSAKVERWDGTQYQYLASIPAPQMAGWRATPQLSYVSPEKAAEPHLSNDETELLALAHSLLNVPDAG